MYKINIWYNYGVTYFKQYIFDITKKKIKKNPTNFVPHPVYPYLREHQINLKPYGGFWWGEGFGVGRCGLGLGFVTQ